MKTSPVMHRSARARYAALALLPLLAAACGEDATRPVDPGPPLPAAPAVAALRCEASVARGTLDCASADPSPGAAGGASRELRIVGGQGQCVRLASQNVAYAGGVFSFDVTVQNQSTLAMATADDATRHDGGVRVFFHEGPTTTLGSGAITVANATGTGTFTAAGQPYFQYGGKVGGVDQGELGAEGILGSAETSAAKRWELNVPATVSTFSFVVYVSTETPPGTLASVSPVVTAIQPAVLVPGASAVLTGVNFDFGLTSQTVTIGGLAATVTSAFPTQLTVTVPCVPSGDVPVQVTRGGLRGAARAFPLQVGSRRALDPGQAAVLSDQGASRCSEILPSGAESRYVVAVYNTSTSPTSSVGFQLAADGDGLAPAATPLPALAPHPAASPGPPPSLDAAMEAARERVSAGAHASLLDRNRAQLERLSRRFAGDERMRPRRSAAVAADPPLTKTIRVPNLNATDFCNNYHTITATRVYYGGKVAIYEDDGLDSALKAANNPAMAAYYQQIGDQYNADMEAIVRTAFGDPLRRDALLDNDGALAMVFTPVINTQFPSYAAFVVSCDLFPNATGNTSSNTGEHFYSMVPTLAGTGYFAGDTPDNWYWTIRTTVIHETKHVASFAARIANSASSYEASWLEEGTARHAEELWAREVIYDAPWKGNNLYGSAAAPGSIYCDVRPEVAACTATNPRRPAYSMFRHFWRLYDFMGSPEEYSPYGRSAIDPGGVFYAVSWSMVRYAIDRYGASDRDFLSNLAQATTTAGTANLARVTGVPAAQLQGEWALALYADDYPGLSSPAPELRIPTWNFAHVYAGLKVDYPSIFSRANRITPRALGLGAFGAVSVPSIVGGGVSYFELSGTHTQAQLLRLQSLAGGTPSSTLRVAIARVQ